MEKIKILELYSGIGGLHYSWLQYIINFIQNEKKEKHYTNEEIEKRVKDIEMISQFISFDLSPIANETYYHNFKNNTTYLKKKNEIDRVLSAEWVKEENNKKMIYCKDEERKSKKKKKYKFDKNKNCIIQTDINNITLQFLESIQFDILFMSNPCQPYTRQNKNFKKVNSSEVGKLNINMKSMFRNEQIEKDFDSYGYHEYEQTDLLHPKDNIQIEHDGRVKSFIHICNLLRKGNIELLPKYIFIENVKNFELSFSFLYFIKSIKHKYDFQTYLLSPLQFGIPNERLRFYCICNKRKTEKGNSAFINHSDIYDNSLIPKNFILCEHLKNDKTNFYTPSITTFLDINEKFSIRNKKWNNLNLYNNHLNEFEVNSKILKKTSAYCFDILNIKKIKNVCCFQLSNHSERKNRYIINSSMPTILTIMHEEKLHSMCFTSNYGRYINGSGSVLFFQEYKSAVWENESCNESLNGLTTKKEKSASYENEEMIKYENKLRYFTPTEISRLMGFKMKTSKIACLNKKELKTEYNEINNFNEHDKNLHGNALWNMDHVNHKCAYIPNFHYCSWNGNFCFHNDKDFLNEHSEKKKSVMQTKKQKKENRLCLCHEFTFPDFLTNRQKYKLIGNSVNIIVVSSILYAHRILENLSLKMGH